MSNEVELTAERVDHAVRAILDRRQTPSVAALRAELGGGDEGRINSLYQDWLDTHDNSVVPAEPEGVAMPAPPTVPQRVVAVLDTLYDAILQELDSQADRVRRERDIAAQNLVDEARAMRAEAERTVAETDARLATMAADMAGLREEIAALTSAKLGLETELRAARDMIAAARSDTDRLTAERDQLKTECDRMAAERGRLAEEQSASAQRLETATAAREAALQDVAALRAERDTYRRLVERDRIAHGGRSPRPVKRRG